MATLIQVIKFDPNSGAVLEITNHASLDSAYEADQANYYSSLSVGYNNDTYVQLTDTESGLKYRLKDERYA